jgi:hypothetical protein
VTEVQFGLDEDGDHFYWLHSCEGLVGRWWAEESGQLSGGLLPLGPEGWTLVQKEPLTVTPSLLCRECGLHGFITDGEWRGV